MTKKKGVFNEKNELIEELTYFNGSLVSIEKYSNESLIQREIFHDNNKVFILKYNNEILFEKVEFIENLNKNKRHAMINRFDNKGFLTELIFEDVWVRLQYENANLISLKDSLGNWVNIEYNNGHKRHLSSSYLKTVDINYDEDGELKSYIIDGELFTIEQEDLMNFSSIDKNGKIYDESHYYRCGYMDTEIFRDVLQYIENHFKVELRIAFCYWNLIIAQSWVDNDYQIF